MILYIIFQKISLLYNPIVKTDHFILKFLPWALDRAPGGALRAPSIQGGRSLVTKYIRGAFRAPLFLCLYFWAAIIATKFLGLIFGPEYYPKVEFFDLIFFCRAGHDSSREIKEFFPGTRYSVPK